MKKLLAGAVVLLATLSTAAADTYPSRPITLVVGFAAGGGVDIVARQLGEQLSMQLGQRIIVLNKPGAGGNLAAEAVAQAEPDGYTLLAANLGILSINPYLYERKAFDPNKDFAHLARTVVTPLMAAVPKASPARTLAEFVALAKAKPGALNYGSGGIGNINHLAVELFASRAVIKMQHLPFRGSAPALNEMVAGRIDLIIDGINLVQPFVDSGDIRALAVTSAERASSAPSVPTAQEAGISDFVVLGWQGISVPAATPAAIRERLAKEIKLALDNPALNQLLLKQGTAPAYLGSADFTGFIAAEQQRWKAVITETGAQVK